MTLRQLLGLLLLLGALAAMVSMALGIQFYGAVGIGVFVAGVTFAVIIAFVPQLAPKKSN